MDVKSKEGRVGRDVRVSRSARGNLIVGALTAIILTASACGTQATTQAASPTPTSATETAAPAPAASEEGPESGTPKVLAKGEFHPIRYKGDGVASIVETDDGGVELQLDPFFVVHGPSLRVYLSSDKAGPPEGLGGGYGEQYIDDFADLGPLKSFNGAQTYPIPAKADWEARKSVVIWCSEFDHGFIVAPIKMQA